MNEICRVVVSGKSFRYSLIFPWNFPICGMNVPCAIHKSAHDRVFMLRMVVWFEVEVTVGVDGFPVNRHGDRAIFLSGCFGVKKGNGTFWFYLDCKCDVRIDGIEMWVEFIYLLSFYTYVAVIYVSKPPFRRVRGRWESLFFDMFHDEIGQDGADWGSHRTTENLLVMVALEYEEIVVEDKL